MASLDRLETNADRLRICRELFDSLDVDQLGRINAGELGRVAEHFGYRLSDNAIQVGERIMIRIINGKFIVDQSIIATLCTDWIYTCIDIMRAYLTARCLKLIVHRAFPRPAVGAGFRRHFGKTYNLEPVIAVNLGFR